jgi:hypothetical protein
MTLGRAPTTAENREAHEQLRKRLAAEGTRP